MPLDPFDYGPEFLGRVTAKPQVVAGEALVCSQVLYPEPELETISIISASSASSGWPK